MAQISIRPMGERDLVIISALGIRSKASWGYSAEEMRVFSQELTLSTEQLRSLLIAEVAVVGGRVVGYFTVRKHPDGITELEHLFVDPDMFCRGVGTRLFQRARQAALNAGLSSLTIICDPNSEGFYQRLGAVKTGDHRSSIPGRTIPIYEISTRQNG